MKNILISKRQFTSLKEELDSLFAFLNNLCYEEDFRQILARANTGNSAVADSIDKTMQTLRMIAGKDLFSCFAKLNHQMTIDMSTRNGQILMMVASYMMKLEEDSSCEYDDITDWIGSIVEPVFVELLDHFIGIYSSDDIMVNSHDGREDFLVGIILYGYNKEYWKTYRVFMYRIASLIAKVDFKVTQEEAKWLAEIMKVTEESDGSNVNENAASSDILDDLIGLETVKHDVRTIYNFVKMKQEREKLGMKAPPISYHCVFTGNPGTGKTTVARILAGIYKELGVLKSGHLVETDRSGLVAEYVGQTAVKANKIIDKALDGVLFIDEAYSLMNDAKEDYGKEAIATLLKRMEDDRDRLIVILAGYTNEMEDFIQSNPGLRSRFSRTIFFPDYSADELYQIFCQNIKKNEYVMTQEAQQYIKGKISEAVMEKKRGFGNARYVRNLFERAIEAQANRLSMEVNLTRETLEEIKKSDLLEI